METVFSHTSGAWAGPRVRFLSQLCSECCLPVAFLLSCFAEVIILEPQFSPNPSFELISYTLLVGYSLLRLSA